jgi:hypothetical protein
MTEAEWLACTDPEALLLHLLDKASDRKLRLFAVACCRRLWDQLKDERSRSFLEVAERYADGQASGAEYQAAYQGARRAEDDEVAEDTRSPAGVLAGAFDAYFWRSPTGTAVGLYSRALAKHAQLASNGVASHLADMAPPAGGTAAEENAAWQMHWDEERALHCRLLRDSIGNPFRPVSARPEWLTPEAVALAQAIYERHAFERLPALADLLHEVGYGDQEMLEHLRGPGPHARGCWALDLVLGKS